VFQRLQEIGRSDGTSVDAVQTITITTGMAIGIMVTTVVIGDIINAKVAIGMNGLGITIAVVVYIGNT
jgi:hypothetical protein